MTRDPMRPVPTYVTGRAVEKACQKLHGRISVRGRAEYAWMHRGGHWSLTGDTV